MEVYKTKPKQVEHAFRWEGMNQGEIREVLAGYGCDVVQYGDELSIGEYKAVNLGDWVVVLEGMVLCLDEDDFIKEFELVEI